MRYCFLPNKICEDCKFLLIGGMLIEGNILWSCHREKCPYVEKEALLEGTTTKNGERIILRKIKEVKMGAKKYRKKPIVVEAIQWTGKNFDEICEFMRGIYVKPLGEGKLKIPTLEGDHIVSEGDFIIKGIKGEFYPCKLDIFRRTYEEMKEVSNGKDYCFSKVNS